MTVENKLNFHWTKYLFLLANVLVVLGLGISWMYTNATKNSTTSSETLKYLPIIICNLIALGCWFACFYYEGKELQILKTIIDKKTMTKYLWSNIAFFIYVFISIVCFSIVNGVAKNPADHLDIRTAYIIALSVTVFCSLVIVGYERYAVLQIELILARRQGLQQKKDEPTSSDLPTSGLVDNASKE